MDQTKPAMRTVRVVIFAMTAAMFVYKIFETDWSYFGGHFRFLTVWGLTASTISAWFMLRLSMGWSTARHEVWASATVVLNLTVLLMYWKIYFEDPTLFYGADGAPSPWYEQYFLHGLGPAIQIYDALFLLGAFRPIRRIALVVTALPIAYLSWVEFVIRPMNDRPIGSVTEGLPYLFLNNLDVAGRAQFYATTTVTMLVLMLLAWGAAVGVRKLRRDPSAGPRSSPTAS